MVILWLLHSLCCSLVQGLNWPQIFMREHVQNFSVLWGMRCKGNSYGCLFASASLSWLLCKCEFEHQIILLFFTKKTCSEIPLFFLVSYWNTINMIHFGVKTLQSNKSTCRDLVLLHNWQFVYMHCIRVQTWWWR